MLKPLRTIFFTALLASASCSVASAGAPAGHRLSTPPAVPAAPYAGRPNYAHAVQPFHWGWFGAERYAPVVRRHTGYYGHPIVWSTHRW